MTNEQLKKLELNLSRSAKRARKFHIRGMVGHTESDQGFFPLISIPIYNTIKGKETTFKEFIEDVGTLHAQYKELKDYNESLKEDIRLYRERKQTLEDANNKRLDMIEKRLSDLEAFNLD